VRAWARLLEGGERAFTALADDAYRSPTITKAVMKGTQQLLVPIGLLALAGFASGSGMRLLDPLLPLVADSLQVTVASTSVLIASFMLPYGLGQAVLGPLGDRLGKLRVVCVAIILYGVFVASCAAASGMAALVTLRAASGLFAGAVIPLMMAYLGDVVPYADRQATLGRFLTGMVMAQMLTGPISGVIGQHAGWRYSFLVLGLFAIGVGATLMMRFGKTLWQAPDTPGYTAVPGPVAYLRLLKRPVGQWLLISAFFDGLCLFGGAFPYVGAFMIDEFGLDAAMTGLIVAGFGIGAFAYTRFARRLVRHFGEGNLLLLGGLGVAAGLMGMALAPSWPIGAAMQVLIGLMFYMFHGVLQARATEVLPEARGAAVSAFALALFLGQGVGALAFGGLLSASGYRFGFMAAAITMLIVTIGSRLGLAVLSRNDRRNGMVA
jgi:predicted MFS family arabinose efflux permease